MMQFATVIGRGLAASVRDGADLVGRGWWYEDTIRVKMCKLKAEG